MAFYGVHPPMSEETKNKIRLTHLGKKKPLTSLAMIGRKNHQWKEIVHITSLHQWVRSHLPKPELCQICSIRPALDLANIGVYDREFHNWKYMCRRCHMISDGRINNLKQYCGTKIEFT